MNRYQADALFFKAFCDENRLRIIEQLRQRELCACHILDELPISQSTLSHHMKIMVECHVVTARKDGKWVYYSLSEEGRHKAERLLKELIVNAGYHVEQSLCIDEEV